MEVSDRSDQDSSNETTQSIKIATATTTDHSNNSKESSRSSAKMLYSKIPIFHVDCDNKDSTIQAVVLCNWDNIYGPKVRNMWVLGRRPDKHNDEKNNGDNTKNNNTSSSSNNDDESNTEEGTVLNWEGLNMIARQALCSEIMKDPAQPHLDSKLVHCPNKHLAMLGVGFGAMSQFDVSMHSLVAVASYARVEVFLRWKDVVDAWLLRCVLQLRVTLATNAANGYALVRDGVKELVRLIDHSPSVLDVPTPSSLWSKDDEGIPLELMHSSVVGHLSLAHHSIVIGSDHALVNKMVHRLSQLSLPQHQHRHHPLTSPFQPYSPELHIQGLHKNDITLTSIGELCGFSDRPSCLIDLDTAEVSLQGGLEEYANTHRSFLTNNLLQLWNECPPSPPILRDIFRAIKVKDSLVFPFLKDMHSLPCHVTSCMSHHVMKMLHRRVLVLMHCLACKLGKPKSTSKSSSRPPAPSSSSGASVESYEGLVKVVRGEMGLVGEWDWRVVLGCAEAMHPGLIHSLKNYPTRV